MFAWSVKAVDGAKVYVKAAKASLLVKAGFVKVNSDAPGVPDTSLRNCNNGALLRLAGLAVGAVTPVCRRTHDPTRRDLAL